MLGHFCLEEVSCLEQEPWGAPGGARAHVVRAAISLPLICVLVLRSSPGAENPDAASCSAVVSRHRAGSQYCGKGSVSIPSAVLLQGCDVRVPVVALQPFS